MKKRNHMIILNGKVYTSHLTEEEADLLCMKYRATGLWTYVEIMES